VAKRLPLEAAEEAIDIVRAGTALRVVLDMNGGRS
jgi:hypothetical protein